MEPPQQNGFSQQQQQQQQQPMFQQQPQFGRQPEVPGGFAGMQPPQQQQQFGQQQPVFGQPPQQQQFGFPPQQQMLMQQPPMMMAPPMAMPAPAPLDQDYFKGFYEGVTRSNSTTVGTAMSWLGPLAVNMVLFLGPMWYLRRRFMQQAVATTSKDGKKTKAGGFMDMMNPMKPKKYRVEIKDTKFAGVVGIPEAKEDLKQYVDFLAAPEKFTRLGARLPRGCLLTGEPGTGKTLLARAVAGEADKPFLTCSGADFIEIFGGSGPKRVRELFAEARECAPCVVFIDEIDAIGSRNSGRSMGGGSSEENRTINQLLAELDGLGSSEAIVVIAATNYAENIDKALLREGRFDRKVVVPMPDHEARSDLFTHYLNGVVTGDANCKPKIIKIKTKAEKEAAAKEGDKAADKKAEEEAAPAVTVVAGVDNKVYAKALADRTPGVSPAQIATIVNEAALTCAVAEEPVVKLSSLQDAIDDVLVGKKHRQRMSEQSLKRTAYHECGHAIMSWGNPLQQDVVKISIIPRGRAGGYTQQVQCEALDPQTNDFLFSQLCTLLGGRVAERLIMGDISTGALDDLQRATKVAMDKILAYGMSGEFGHLAFKPNDQNDGRAAMTYSEALHAEVEREARALVDRAYDHTYATLSAQRGKLVELSEALLAKKELMKPDVEAIMGARPVKEAKKKAVATA
jgi:AFG3 family protein